MIFLANTITAVLDVLFSAGINVSRELSGFVQSARQDFSDKGAALNTAIKVPVVTQGTASDFTPAATVPAGSDSTVTTADVTITKSRKQTWRYTGEEERSILQNRPEIFRQSTEAAMRTLVNEVELDLFNEAYKNASRATGTAGTTPFASTLAGAADVRRILDDNGAPLMRRKLVINTATGAALRTLAQLTKANEAAASDTLRQGVLLDLHGFQIRESGQIVQHVKGAATGALINNASTEAIGQTTLTLDTITVNTTGFKAGDVITHASDSSNKYMVRTGLVATSGDIVIGSPGLKIAAADNDAVTIGNSYTPNVAFVEDSLILVARPPILEANGIIDVTPIKDPVSGLTFLVARLSQYGQITWEVHLAWGVKVLQPEHVAILLG